MIDERDYVARDAVGLAALVRAGEVTARELAEAAIRRIESRNGELNAVIHKTYDKALATAEAIDAARSGRSVRTAAAGGLFAGVPTLLKDLYPPSEGDPCHLGTRVLRDIGFAGPNDGNQVICLRRAGFSFAGRTNTPELGQVATTEPLAYGPTHNPWKVGHGPGGSSGGSAAAVASGMVPVATGGDGGGSIRIPAALCGLVGLKPSRGRVSNSPHNSGTGLVALHALTRTVRDSAALLDVQSAPFAGDTDVAPRQDTPYSEVVKGPPPERLRVGLRLERPAASAGEVHPDCAEAARRAARLLERCGHTVEPSAPAAFDDEQLLPMFIKIWTVATAAALRALSLLVGRPLEEADVEPATWFYAQRGQMTEAHEFLAAVQARQNLGREMARWWVDGWDVLLTPTTAQPAPPLGELMATDDDPIRALANSLPYGTFTLSFNLTGQPAISIPMGQTADGLPLGAQLVAAYGREDLLLQVAAQLEAANPWPHVAPD
ncbi:MAG: amidase [bacterium]|nr:amidase [bacterium]